MGSYAALNVITWLSGYDLTGDSNNTSLALSYDALDSTVYGCTARTRAAGLEDTELQSGGFWEAGTGKVDPTVIAALGGVSQVVTNAADPNESTPAYFYRAKAFNYQQGGQVGELYPFQLTAQSARGTGLASVGAVRGRILKTKANVSATGATGTAQQLGAAGAGQFLYAGLHIFSAGTTVTGVIESAPDNTFGAATTRITFSAVTAVGGYWGARVAGAITDPWFRLRITAITGTFSLACVAGIR